MNNDRTNKKSLLIRDESRQEVDAFKNEYKKNRVGVMCKVAIATTKAQNIAQSVNGSYKTKPDADDKSL